MPFQAGEGNKEAPEMVKAGATAGESAATSAENEPLSTSCGEPDLRGHGRVDDECLWALTAGGVNLARTSESPLTLENGALVMVSPSRESPLPGLPPC